MKDRTVRYSLTGAIFFLVLIAQLYVFGYIRITPSTPATTTITTTKTATVFISPSRIATQQRHALPHLDTIRVTTTTTNKPDTNNKIATTTERASNTSKYITTTTDSTTTDSTTTDSTKHTSYTSNITTTTTIDSLKYDSDSSITTTITTTTVPDKRTPELHIGPYIFHNLGANWQGLFALLGALIASPLIGYIISTIDIGFSIKRFGHFYRKAPPGVVDRFRRNVGGGDENVIKHYWENLKKVLNRPDDTEISALEKKYTEITRYLKLYKQHFICLCKNQKKDARDASNRLEELFNVAVKSKKDGVGEELIRYWTNRWDFYWAHIHGVVASIMATIIAAIITCFPFQIEINLTAFFIIEIVVIIFICKAIYLKNNIEEEVVRSEQDWLLSQ